MLIEETYGSYASIGIRTVEDYGAFGQVEISFGDSFLIMADVLAASIAGVTGGEYGALEINARLTVNNVVVPITSFGYQAPTGRLGSLLNVRLSKPDINQIPDGASVKFELLVTTPSGVQAIKLIDNGKLSGKDFRITYRGGTDGRPQDEVNMSALDVISDKFTLAPRRPVVMFDPIRVKITDVETSIADAIRTEAGAPIMPILEPYAGLTMKQVLQRAYTTAGGTGITTIDAWILATMTRIAHLLGTSNDATTGIGFAAVVTNIPNYNVRRADFTMEGGWHGGAGPVVGMYSPLYFVENNTLFIIDPEKPLPFGYTPRLITLAKHKSLSQSTPYKPESNAVLLTYQYSAEDEPDRTYYIDRTTESTDENGAFGSAGYSSVMTRRTVREFYITGDPLNIVSEVEKSIVVETRQAITWTTKDENETVTEIVVSASALTHKETTDFRYQGDLLMGHRKVVEGCIYVGSQKQVFTQTILIEDASISWADDPLSPGRKVQKSTRTTVDGVCFLAEDPEVVAGENADGEEIYRLYPALLAQSSGVVAQDAVLIGMRPITTTTETLKHIKGNQYEVAVVVTDHLNNTVKRSVTSPRTGGTGTDPYAVRSRTILLRDLVSEAAIGPRLPTSVNALELPREQALSLGKTILKRLLNPLRAMPLDLPGVDFAINRGSVLQGQTRTGQTLNYFVTGYGISGNNLGKQGHRISMSLETTELLAL